MMTTPGRFELYRLELLNRGQALIDLTVSNPTECGLFFPTEQLGRKLSDYLRTRRYAPDPRGLYEARVAVRNHLNTTKRSDPTTRTSCIVEADHIFLTASTSESYSHIFHLLSEEAPGPVLIPQPGYPLVEHLLRYQKVPSAHYYLIRSENRWVVDEAQLARQFHSFPRPSGMVVIRPHNPTGHIWEDIGTSEAILSDIPIISDEVFGELSGCPTLQTANDRTQNPVFTLGGLSKSCGLPDFKIGWIALNPRAYEQYGAALEFLNDIFLSANHLAQTSLGTIFELHPEYQSMVQRRIEQNRKSIAELLGLAFLDNLPSRGTYFPLSLKTVGTGKNSGVGTALEDLEDEECALELLRRGVVTHPGYFYDLPAGYLVITNLAEPDQFRTGISMITPYLNLG